MRIRVGCEFGWRTEAPVPMLMLVRPRPDAEHRAVYESSWIEPTVPLHEYNDAFGNICWRFTAPAGLTSVRYDAIVELDPSPDPVVPDAQIHPVEELPDDVVVFTLASRYVESDLLGDRAWELFGSTPPTWRACRRSATSYTTTSRSGTGRAGRTSRPCRSWSPARASAGTSLSCRSRSAAR